MQGVPLDVGKTDVARLVQATQSSELTVAQTGSDRLSAAITQAIVAKKSWWLRNLLGELDDLRNEIGHESIRGGLGSTLSRTELYIELLNHSLETLLCEELRLRAEAERGPKPLQLPERWMDNPHWRCINDHVSECFLKSEALQRDCCPACQAPCYLTFPEDKDGPLVFYSGLPGALIRTTGFQWNQLYRGEGDTDMICSFEAMRGLVRFPDMRACLKRSGSCEVRGPGEEGIVLAADPGFRALITKLLQAAPKSNLSVV
jgi:hypothetical protein